MPSFRDLQESVLRTAPRNTVEPRPAAIPVPVARAMVDCGVYADGKRLHGKFTHAAALAKAKDLRADGVDAFVWVGLHEPDLHQMTAIAEVFGLHPLTVEDAVHAHQRPKLERYDDTLFLVLKTVTYVEHERTALSREVVHTGEVMIFVGPDFVVTVRHGEHGGLAGVRKDLESSPDRLALGPFAVLHAIADHVVDNYLDITNLIWADIDVMEENVFSPRTPTDIECIYMLKREIVELRRAITPLTPALQKLITDLDDLVSKEVRRYVRDVFDHNSQAADRIASYDDMLSSLVEAALGKVAMQQNVDMRKISAWVAIAAVPTMLAGIYGMNFDDMPELHWTFGYPAILLVMIGVCLFLYRNFRRNGWL